MNGVSSTIVAFANLVGRSTLAASNSGNASCVARRISETAEKLTTLSSRIGVAAQIIIAGSRFRTSSHDHASATSGRIAYETLKTARTIFSAERGSSPARADNFRATMDGACTSSTEYR